MVKAVVLGAAGGIGQPLSLLLKGSAYIDELSLYDVVNAPGVAADLSHISTKAKVTGFLPENDGLKRALSDGDIVIIPAGIPRKPGMTRDDLFAVNASIVKGLVAEIAITCPKAFILMISNPVNSTVPIAAEVLKEAGVFDPCRLFGVTTLDIIRAQTFATEFLAEHDPARVSVPVVGGHSGDTIVPLYSRTQPKLNVSQGALEKLVKRVQFGGDEVVQAKGGSGSATLSMAHAAFRFFENVMLARNVDVDVEVSDIAYVHLSGIEGGQKLREILGLDYFAIPLRLGTSGAQHVMDVLDSISSDESTLIEAAKKGLTTSITNGIRFFKESAKANAK